MWTQGVEVEAAAMQQLRNVAALPFIYKHVAVMPDVHWGMGATVGSIIATRGAIVPAAVGVDIGCGMAAVKLNLKAHDLPDDLSAMRSAIEAAVPHGRTDNGGANDRGAWSTVPSSVYDSAKPLFHSNSNFSAYITQQLPVKRGWSIERAARQLGTLGTGNHFIEVCLDEDNSVWVVLHSGSRGIGNAIGQEFIGRAQRNCEAYFIPLPDKDLAYLPEGSPDFEAYMQAVGWAQDYASVNRGIMLRETLNAIAKVLNYPAGYTLLSTEAAVNCHHNYVQRENHFGKNVLVTRKGAVSAREGQLGIIPGSMGARTYIVAGKGNPESFMSCSHGAGRRMSRNEAKKRFTLADHAAATQGVECRKDEGVIDETPGAYKDIDAVMAAQSDLVEVKATLHQVICVKG
jgi:tRNA-splicing ligase RtcB